MKSILTIFIFVVLPIMTLAQPDTLWTRTYGGDGRDWCYAVQQTSDGGYILGGYTESFGAENQDVFLVKTNGFGDTIWTCTVGGDSDDAAYSLQQTTDGGYIVAGNTESFGAANSNVYLCTSSEQMAQEVIVD